mmetsp:Transcript_32751/g.27688  ORF Transcript_32751/g.27688 Transcript_32751/m.27688 type:complete len:123 (-) Transcript_32751:99-467(-)
MTLKKCFANANFDIVLIPCGQFMSTEPLSNSEIKTFLSNKNVYFDILSKMSINGPHTHPLYKYLRRNSDLYNPNNKVCAPVTWNFEKFLVNPNGNIIEHWVTSEPLNPYELIGQIGKYVDIY